MDSNTASKLIELNQLFYQTFALQFSLTRQRLQPGVRRILESLRASAHILDLGCGNGELARQLAKIDYRGTYTGLDFSTSLLAEARARMPPSLPAIFRQADLSQPGWAENLPHAPFDMVLAFAVFHHLPGVELRRQVLQRAGDLLTPDGRLIHSEWQFLNSPRLAARILPWKSVGLTPAQVDPQDYLLDWRQGGVGRRYVHLFTAEEFEKLAAECGLKVVNTYYSDGEGDKLSLYQILERQKGSS
jgi:tRNA (uracil-5-)-methyltransferase TRM9